MTLEESGLYILICTAIIFVAASIDYRAERIKTHNPIHLYVTTLFILILSISVYSLFNVHEKNIEMAFKSDKMSLVHYLMNWDFLEGTKYDGNGELITREDNKTKCYDVSKKIHEVLSRHCENIVFNESTQENHLENGSLYKHIWVEIKLKDGKIIKLDPTTSKEQTIKEITNLKMSNKYCFS